MFAINMKKLDAGILTFHSDLTSSVCNAVSDFMYGRPFHVTSANDIRLYKFVQRYKIVS